MTTLAKALGAIPCDFLADVSGAVGPPTLDAFCERIVAERYTLVHMVCHGTTNARDGETTCFSPLPAAGWIASTARGSCNVSASWTRLPACRTWSFWLSADSSPGTEDALGGLAQRLVRGLGHATVIAMSDLVSLSTAQALASGFYTRLAQHGEVDRASDQGVGRASSGAT